MTTPKRTVTRELRACLFECGRNRAMMASIRDGVIYLWPKGTRRRYPVNPVGTWQRAVKAEVLAVKAAKKARRRTR